MKKIIYLILSALLVSSCDNSTNKNSISSSYNNDFIVDAGDYEKAETYVVGAKVVTSTGDKVLPFNTMMNLTTYSDEAYEKLTPIYDSEIKRLHILFDRYNEYLDKNGKTINNLKIINDSYGSNKEIKIDDDLFNLLEMSIKLSELTEGYFNPTMGYLIDGWSEYFTPYGVEDKTFNINIENKLIERKSSIVEYDDLKDIIVLNKKNKSVKFNKNSKSSLPCIISLGAIAKGYAIEKMRQVFSKHQTPFIISGSASSSYVHWKNPNKNRENWNILVNSPFKNLIMENYPLLLSEITPNKVMSTSGDYEQLFYYKNNDSLIRRHHILNPYSGHSESYYRSINLYSDTRSDILDGLSTALFNINNFDLITSIIDNVESYYNISIDYLFQEEVEEMKVNIYYDDGFLNTISKYYEDVEVINKVRIEE